MSRVTLVRCETYDYETVEAAVERGLGLLGGPQMFAKQGEKILLKPNLLVGEPPEKCITTHPAVFKAVARVFQKTGAVLFYGDSPGILVFEGTEKKTGLAEVAAEMGVSLADFRTGTEIFFQEGVQNKKFRLARGVLECDGLISLPKLKTHGLTKITGAVKNQFGCIPGHLKAEFHARIPKVESFARMLVDLNRFLAPRLFIIDGIMAMEGNGPRGGTPRKLGVLMFSADPVALDATACRIIDLPPEDVPTNKFGAERGLGTYHEDEIEIVGDELAGFFTPDFRVRREPPAAIVRYLLDSRGLQVLRNSLVPKPCIEKEKCKKCGVCVQVCPVRPKAVDWPEGRIGRPEGRAGRPEGLAGRSQGQAGKLPVYTYKRCIRCYCCQELCPEGAIRLKMPFLRRLLGGVGHWERA